MRRFPAADNLKHHGGAQERFRRECIHEIERQATETWRHPTRKPQAAWDYFVVEIPPNHAEEERAASASRPKRNTRWRDRNHDGNSHLDGSVEA